MSGQLFFVSITPFLIIFVSYAQNGVKTTVSPEPDTSIVPLSALVSWLTAEISFPNW